MQICLLFCTKKNYFFYFRHSFLQNTCISLSILHIHSIKYSFFYHFLLFSPSPLFSHRPHLKVPKPKPISLRTTLSFTDPNHHHTNLKILALTKHSFITSFIASSLQWVLKVNPPLLWLQRLIGEALVHRIVMSLHESDQNLRILTPTKKIGEKVMKLRIGGSEGIV